MTNKTVTIITLLIGFTIGIQLTISPLRLKEAVEESDKAGESDALKSFEWWYTQRALPYDNIPHTAFQKAARYLKTSMKKERISKLNAVQSSEWTSMGPTNIGGRVLSLTVDPANPNIVWAGSASGGLWKSTTGGTGSNAWSYVNTGFNALSISAIALDPANSNIIYIGTGEISTYQRPLIGTPGARASYGMGILKSSDGGITWAQTGLTWTFPEITAIQKIVINPLNSQTLFTATSEGVFKSLDAGVSWTKSNQTLMAMDVVMNPNDTTVLFSSHGNMNSSPNPGLYKTTNAGASWFMLTNGLPSIDFGRTSLSISPSNPSIIYAGIADASSNRTSGLYKSTDGGNSWTVVNSTNIFGGSSPQGWYDNVVAIHPTNPDIVYFGGIDIYKSTNGGGNLTGISFGVVHVDQHAMAFDPSNPNVIYFGSDGGVYKTTDGGTSFANCNHGFITTQFYPGFANAFADSSIMIGGLQDNGTLKYSGSGYWFQILGADGGWCAIDPNNSNIMYYESQWLQLYKTTNGGSSATYSTTGLPTGSGSANFIAPVVIAPSNSSILYAGSKNVYKTTNGGNSWFSSNGQATLNGTSIACIGVSWTSADTLLAATGTGTFGLPSTFEVFSSTNGGQSWTNVTNHLNGNQNLPNRYPTDIEFDPSNSSVTYLTYSSYGTPHIFRTTNMGQSWTNISGILPDIPHQAVCIDPEDENNIYVGTDLGVFHSSDYGANWEEFNNGMPPAMVLDVTISRINGKLRASTFGNGVYERPLVRIPSVTMLIPNGGEVWVSGTSELIQWSQKFTDSLKLEYTSDDGTTWNLIAENILASERSYLWSIPPIGRDQALIRITSIGSNSVTDSSDAPFTILPYADVIPGWNLLSIHERVSDPRTSAIFPTAISQAFTYDKSYQTRDSVLNGAGYWLKFDYPQIIPIIGDSIVVDTFDVKAGWNMIGSISKSVAVNNIIEIPPGIVTSGYSGYNNSYIIADTIKPRVGYWVKVNTDGKLVLSSSVSQLKYSKNIFSYNHQMNKLTISDADGSHQILYFTIDGGDLDLGRYELPPTPPYGTFDARFANQRMLEIIPNNLQSYFERAIIFTSQHPPITFSWEIGADNIEYSLIDANRNVIPMVGKGSINIQQPTTKVVLHAERSSQATPLAFKLEQNYPNPFNPVTKIHYEIPITSRVIIKVYDLSGKEIAILANEKHESGKYEIRFDGSRLPSGIYFYRLSTDEFESTKKFILLK